MFPTLWLLIILVNCQHLCFISSEFVMGGPPPSSHLANDFNPSKLQQQVPAFGVMELPFRAPSRARQPSRTRQGQKTLSENQQVPPSGELQQMTDSEKDIQLAAKERENEAQKRPHGAPYKFCNQFGCHSCNPPEGAKCCSGFKYDRKANRCRELV